VATIIFTCSRAAAANPSQDVIDTMSMLIPQIDADIEMRGIEYTDYALEVYAPNFDFGLTDEIRIKEGLVKQLQNSRRESGKKFFVSDSNHYVDRRSASTLFSSCNMTKLVETVYNNVKERPFAVLMFKD
jgi:hypothetical protein